MIDRKTLTFIFPFLTLIAKSTNLLSRKKKMTRATFSSDVAHDRKKICSYKYMDLKSDRTFTLELKDIFQYMQYWKISFHKTSLRSNWVVVNKDRSIKLLLMFHFLLFSYKHHIFCIPVNQFCHPCKFLHPWCVKHCNLSETFLFFECPLLTYWRSSEVTCQSATAVAERNSCIFWATKDKKKF